MDTDELAAMMLPWAKEHHPEKYAQTLAVSLKPPTYRRYLIRLVEIRWTEDRAWRGQVSLSVLDESAIVGRVRHRPTGAVLEVKGRLAQGERAWKWSELAETPEWFAEMMRAKAMLDLVHVE